MPYVNEEVVLRKQSGIHSLIHEILKVVGANHDHWTSRLKVSDKDTQMF